MQLNREAAGKYLFRNRPVIATTGATSPSAVILLEQHEHSHWELANVTIFGLEQQALAETINRSTKDEQSTALRSALENMIEASFLCYESVALNMEEVWVALGPLDPPPDWFSFADDPRYAEALSLVREMRAGLRCSIDFFGIIEHNLAELCRNSCGPYLWDRSTGRLNDPRRFDAQAYARRVANDRPDDLFRSCIHYLKSRPEWLELLAAKLDPLFSEFGVPSDPMRSAKLFGATDRLFSGYMAYTVYEWLQTFLGDHAPRLRSWDLRQIDQVRSHIWHNWMAHLDDEQAEDGVLRPTLSKTTGSKPFFKNVSVDPKTEAQKVAWEKEHRSFSMASNSVDLHPIRRPVMIVAENWFDYASLFLRAAGQNQFTLVGIDFHTANKKGYTDHGLLNLTRVSGPKSDRLADLKVSPVVHARMARVHCLLGLIEELRSYSPIFYSSPLNTAILYEHVHFSLVYRPDDIFLTRLDLEHEDHWRRFAKGMGEKSMVSVALYREANTSANFLITMGTSAPKGIFISPVTISFVARALSEIEADPEMSKRINFFDGVERLPITDRECQAIRAYCKKIAIYGV